MKVTVYGGERTMYTGYITACRFRFGVQARATLSVAAAARTDVATLTVILRWNDRILDKRRYLFPVGYAYRLANEYLDQTWDGVRRIYRPLTEVVEGVMVLGGASVTVEYAEALVLQDGVLSVISVDSVTEDTEDETTIGGIA